MRSRLCSLRRAASLARSLVGALTVSACAPQSSRVGAGGECFLATDCAPGLICIEQADKTRLCSDDLSRVAGGPAHDVRAEADGGSDEEETPDAGPQPPDSSTPDND